MAVERTTSRWTYVPNGITTAFPFDSLVLEATDLSVLYYDAGGSLVSRPDYAVTGLGNASGGTVTFVSPPPVVTGGQLVIERVTKPLQQANFRNFRGLPAETQERMADKPILLAQELRRAVKRGIQLSPLDADGADLVLPPRTALANRYLYVRADGTIGGIEGPAPPLGTPYVVSSFTELRAQITRPDLVFVRGRRGGVFELDAVDTTTVDDGALTIVTVSQARYKRRYNEFLDARWFIEDFSAASAGLNAALAAAASTTRCVVLPRAPTDYIIDGAIVVPSGVSFIGTGLPTIRLKSACSPLPPVMITGDGLAGARSSDVVIEGICFNGNRLNNINHGTPDGAGNQAPGWEGLPVAAVSFGFTDGIKVRDVQCKNMWASGVWLVDCTDEEVTGGRNTAYRKAGISVRRFVPTALPGATTARFLSNYCSGGTVGLHAIFGTARMIFEANYLEENRDASAYPSFAWDGVYPNVWPKGDGQTWTKYGEPGYQSPALPGDGAGIELSGYHTVPGAARERFVLANSNICFKNAVGVRLEQECKNVVVSDNICAINDLYGILAYSATDAILQANQCIENGEHGISVAKATGQAACANIQILDNQLTRNRLFGLAIERGISVIVGDNMFIDNYQAGTGLGGAIGLFRDGPDGCLFVNMSGNFINQTGGYWLYYDDVGHTASFIDNECRGAPTSKMNNVNRVNTDVRGNIGILTRAKGGNTVAQNGAVVINHGLDFTPNVADIRPIPVGDLLADGRLYVGPVPTSTTFTVVMAGGPATLNFAWSIDDQ